MFWYFIIALIAALVLFGLTFDREYWLPALILSVVVGLLNLGLNYLNLTVLNWGYWGLPVEIFFVAVVGLIYGAFLIEVDYDTANKVMLRSGITAGVVLLLMIGAAFFSGEMVNSKKYNQKLALERAEKIKAYMVSKGVPANRISTRGIAGRNKSKNGTEHFESNNVKISREKKDEDEENK